MRRLGAALLALAAVAACGTQASTGAVRTTRTASPGGDPSRLVATWTVSSPPASKGDIVNIGDKVDGGLDLFLHCGLMFGSWRAGAQGLFVAVEDGGDSSCFSSRQNDPWPAWLDAVGFSYDGADALLLSAQGEVLARLTPGGHPTTGPNDSPEFASPPGVTADMRDKFKEPAALPDGVKPATESAVQGRWVPVDRLPAKAYLEFKPGNIYTGSDGCNGADGRYVMGSGGRFIATSGGSTLIGCDNSALPTWPLHAGRVGLRDGRLVFVDPDGKVLGEAVRA